MKRVSHLLPAAIALFVLGGCVINEKKPADSAPIPPPATAAPMASVAPTDAGATTDAAPATTANRPGPVLKKPPSRDAGAAK